MNIVKFLLIGLFWFMGLLLMAVLTAFPTMLLWDWLVVKFFKLPEIQLIEALGLNMLSGILFRSSPSSEKKS